MRSSESYGLQPDDGVLFSVCGADTQTQHEIHTLFSFFPFLWKNITGLQCLILRI